MLISIDNHITCDFLGGRVGVRTPIPPLYLNAKYGGKITEVITFQLSMRVNMKTTKMADLKLF